MFKWIASFFSRQNSPADGEALMGRFQKMREKEEGRDAEGGRDGDLVGRVRRGERAGSGMVMATSKALNRGALNALESERKAARQPCLEGERDVNRRKGF